MGSHHGLLYFRLANHRALPQMPNAFQEEITGLLLAWGNGDRDALDRLVSLLAGVSTPTIEREWRAARLWRDHALATGAGR